MSVNYVALGKRIGYFRMQCGNITQEALASKINRSREFLAKIEKGTEHPSVTTLVDIADLLCQRSPKNDFCPSKKALTYKGGSNVHQMNPPSTLLFHLFSSSDSLL